MNGKKEGRRRGGKEGKKIERKGGRKEGKYVPQSLLCDFLVKPPWVSFSIFKSRG